MIGKFFPEMDGTLLRKIVIVALLVLLMMAMTMCAQPQSSEAPAEAEAPAETEAEAPTEAPVEAAEEEMAEGATLAIEHFSVIEGTTWSGAHDRAGKRIAEKYPNVEYVFREEVGPDLSVPYAEELISDGADYRHW